MQKKISKPTKLPKRMSSEKKSPLFCRYVSNLEGRKCLKGDRVTKLGEKYCEVRNGRCALKPKAVKTKLTAADKELIENIQENLREVVSAVDSVVKEVESVKKVLHDAETFEGTFKGLGPTETTKPKSKSRSRSRSKSKPKSKTKSPKRTPPARIRPPFLAAIEKRAVASPMKVRAE